MLFFVVCLLRLKSIGFLFQLCSMHTYLEVKQLFVGEVRDNQLFVVESITF